MKRILFGIVGLLLLAPTAALAQPSASALAEVVASCGGKAYSVGDQKPVTQTQAGAACTSGGGGGAATIADGADVTQGAKADAKSTATDTTPITMMQVLKQISASIQAAAASAAAATPAGTNQIGFVGGYEFNTSVIPTVQNAAYAAGQSLGGLQTISIGSTNSLSGILDQVSIASTGGSTVAAVMYVWDKNPSGTTCTDKTNFVKSQTDNQHLITGAPILLTPALVVSAQDATTYAAAANLTNNFVNSSTNTNLYVCLLANASVTPATTTDYRINIQGVKDQQ